MIDLHVQRQRLGRWRRRLAKFQLSLCLPPLARPHGAVFLRYSSFRLSVFACREGQSCRTDSAPAASTSRPLRPLPVFQVAHSSSIKLPLPQPPPMPLTLRRRPTRHRHIGRLHVLLRRRRAHLLMRFCVGLLAVAGAVGDAFAGNAGLQDGVLIVGLEGCAFGACCWGLLGGMRWVWEEGVGVPFVSAIVAAGRLAGGSLEIESHRSIDWLSKCRALAYVLGSHHACQYACQSPAESREP